MKIALRNYCTYRARRTVWFALFCLLVTLPAAGHAILKECLPAPHSVVAGPNITIRLKFNSRVDAAHSRLYLNQGSHSQAVGIAENAAPDTLMGEAKNVAAGEYRIQWQVLAVDGHITRGEVPFTVR